MAKTLDANQVQKVDKRFLQPLYFVHILNVGGAAETLYFSDRTFKYNGHDYEDYLTELPALAQSIERFGGYLNINAQLTFKNQRFRASNTLLEWFDSNPITRKELELYVLYVNTGETFGSDVSTKLCRLGIGELKQITRQSFQADLCTVLHLLDQKNILYRVDTSVWPNADPKVVGQAGNIVYGSVKDVPCQCVKTGAYSTLRENIGKSKIELPLTETDYPIVFTGPGHVHIDEEIIYFGSVDSATNTLKGCVRAQLSTLAATHKAGAPVIKRLATYKWMVAGHVCKAVNAVKVDRVKIPATDYTVTLNDGGVTTLEFTERKILKHQGEHSHPVTATVKFYAKKTGASVSPASPGFNWGYTAGGPAAAVDRNESTFFKIRGAPVSPPLLAAEMRTLIVTFKTYVGPAPSAVYLCVNHKTSLIGSVCKADVVKPAIYPLVKSGQQQTERFLLAGVTVPTTAKMQLSMPAGAVLDGIISSFYEVWIELDIAETGAGAASGVYGRMDDVFSPLLTADVEGFKDDVGGTYTGTPSALIQNPSDVRRHFLMAVLGRVAGDIDSSSFNTARANYNTLNYKTNSILNRISEVPSEILRVLDEETRSMLKEDQGKWFLNLVEYAAPTSILTVTKDDIYGDVAFGQTPIDDVRNKIRARYDIDWGGDNTKNHYIGNFYKFLMDSNAASITKYGELAEDREFKTTKTTDQVTSVVAWILKQKRDVLKTASFEASHVFRKMERGDYFTLTWVFWTAIVWRILSIGEIPGTQRFAVEALEYRA